MILTATEFHQSASSIMLMADAFDIDALYEDMSSMIDTVQNGEGADYDGECIMLSLLGTAIDRDEPLEERAIAAGDLAIVGLRIGPKAPEAVMESTPAAFDSYRDPNGNSCDGPTADPKAGCYVRRYTLRPNLKEGWPSKLVEIEIMEGYGYTLFVDGIMSSIESADLTREGLREDLKASSGRGDFHAAVPRMLRKFWIGCGA